MNSNKLQFLVNEYLNLWTEHGVDCRPLRKAPLMEQLESLSEPQGTPAAPPEYENLEQVQEWLGDCRRCQLCEGRNKIVFGSGNPRARLLFVGEGPGANEDAVGLPFVGRAGNLLTKIIEAMGYDRSEVYIANVVKCRPPQNRTPLPHEAEECFPFLKAQIQVIAPKIIVALGLPASTTLVGKQLNMGQLRGRFHPLPWNPQIMVMPTYHPAYLLRNPPAKRFVWSDMKLVRSKLETLQ